MEKQRFNYKTVSGILNEAEVISLFEVKGHKFLFYTDNKLENISDENQTITLSLSNLNMIDNYIELEEVPSEEFTNMVKLVASIMGAGKAIEHVDDFNEYMNQKLETNDFKLLNPNELDNKIIEESNLNVPMRTPVMLKYVNQIKKVNETIVSKMEIETTLNSNLLNEEINVDEPVVVEQNQEQIEQPVTIDETTLESTLANEESNMDEPAIVEENQEQSPSVEEVVATEVNPIENGDNTVSADEELTLDSTMIDEKPEDEQSMQEDDNVKILNHLEDDFLGKVESIANESQKESSSAIAQMVSTISTAVSGTIQAIEEKHQQNIENIKQYNKDYMDGIKNSIFGQFAEEITQLGVQLNQISSNYKEIGIELDSEKAKNNELETQNNELLISVNEKDEKINTLEKDLEDEKTANKSHIETIQHQEKTIDEQNFLITENNEKYKNLEADNLELQNKVNGLQEQINTQNEQHSAELSEKDKQIKQLEDRVESDNNTINNQTNIINSKSEEIRNLTDQLRDSMDREFTMKKVLGMAGPSLTEGEQNKTL